MSPWQTTVRLASREGLQDTCRILVAQGAIHLSFDFGVGAVISVLNPLTPNMAGDLAHALQEAIAKAEEGKP